MHLADETRMSLKKDEMGGRFSWGTSFGVFHTHFRHDVRAGKDDFTISEAERVNRTLFINNKSPGWMLVQEHPSLLAINSVCGCLSRSRPIVRLLKKESIQRQHRV